jgi:hypothetical protein
MGALVSTKTLYVPPARPESLRTELVRPSASSLHPTSDPVQLQERT